MAKNIEYIHPSEEQLDPLVVEIRQQCYHQAIPLVYSMTRRQLGQATGEARGRRAGGVACLALLMIDGAEPLYEQVLNQAEKDSTNWRNYFCSLSPSTESAMPWNNYRETPIWLAAWHGYSVDVVRICLEKGWPIDACPITIPATDNGNSNASENEYHHWTPLMAAAYRGHTHLVAYLLANGANVNAQDQQNRSALWLAVEQGHVQVVKELLKPIHGTDATIRDKHDQTVLHVAIQKNHVKIIEILRQLN
ncbi:ankyrin repeat-containing domain protein [Syncephalis plumigaleata]|nr:ankyrin repeat-containing domain protein [Syncephalis plumigaleata]